MWAAYLRVCMLLTYVASTAFMFPTKDSHLEMPMFPLHRTSLASHVLLTFSPLLPSSRLPHLEMRRYPPIAS